MLVNLIILSFCLFFSVTVASTCGDPISCALDNIVVEVPDTEIAISDTSTLTISNLVCKDVAIQSFPSRYVPPTTLGVDVQGLHVACNGDYKFDTGSIKKYKGTMAAVIKDTNFTLDFYLNKPPNSEFATEMSFSSCWFPSMVIEVDFQGKSGADFSALEAAAKAFLSKFLNSFICVKFASFVYYNGSYALQNNINPALAAIIDTSPSPVPETDFSYINWGNTILGVLADGAEHGSSGGNSQLIETISYCFLEEFPDYVQQPFLDSLINLKTNSTGSIDILVNKTVPVRNGTFTIDTVSLIGLNSFKTISIIAPSPTSNISLATTIMLDKLVILMNSTSESNPEQGFVENRQFKFAISNVTLDMDFAFGVNQTHVQSLYMDQFLDHGCLLESIQFLNVTSLVGKVSIDEISLVQISGSAAILEQNTVEIFDNGFQLLTDGFNDLVTDLIAGVFQGAIRHAINEKIALSLEEGRATSVCAPHEDYGNNTDYIVWYNNSMIKLLDMAIGDSTGMNRLMGCITNHTGSLSVDRPYWSIDINGLDSFFNLTLLSPYPPSTREEHPYNLINSIGLGYCPGNPSPNLNPDCNRFTIKFVAKGGRISEEKLLLNPVDSWLQPLSVDEIISSGVFDSVFEYQMYHFFKQLSTMDPSTGFLGSLGSSESDETAPLTSGLPAGTSFYLAIENFYLYVNLYAKLDKNLLNAVQVNQMGTTGCVAQSFNTLTVSDLTLAVSNVSLVVNDGTRSRDFTKSMNTLLAFLTSPVQVDTVNQNINAKLSQAPAVCQNGGVLPSTDDDIVDGSSKSPWQWELTLLVVGCAVCLALLLYGYYHWGRTGAILCLRGRTKEHGLLDDQETEAIHDTRSFYDRWGFEDALCCQVKLPWLLRVGIVVAVVGNMACFLNSNLDPDAVLVEAEIDLLSKVAKPPPVFAFGLKSTVQDMWDAGVYPLAILIAFFSGAWPYVKLAIMGACWVAPSQLMTIKRREELLRLMDILGKWSLIDFFVMVMMMCAFMFNMSLGANLTIKVTVVPGWGFYGFLLATMVSLGLGHIILACHRLIVEPKVPAVPNVLAAKESLFMHIFKVPSRLVPTLCLFHAPVDNTAPTKNGPSSRTPNVVFDKAAQPANITTVHNSALNSISSKYVFVKATYLGGAVTTALLLATLVILYFGTSLKTFTFHFKGLTGVILQEKADVAYSFNSVGTTVPISSGKPNDFAVRWMEACYFAFGVGMPAAFIVVLGVLWLVPLSLSRQRLWFVVAEVLNAWSALDVFCISIAAALVEIQQFAAFMVGDSCDQINKLLAAIDTKIGYNGEGKCFDVIATLNGNCWTIFLAAGMLIIVGIPFLSVSHWVIKDRIEHTRMWHSNSFQNNLARAQDLLEANQKNGPTDGVTANYDSEVRNPLLSTDIHESGTAAIDPNPSSAVRFNIPEEPQPASNPPDNNYTTDDHGNSNDNDNEKQSIITHSAHLTIGEKFQSMLIRSMVFCNLIVVVDPADVRGLEAIGMGVANTLSQSIRMSTSITAGLEPPVYTGDNDYDESGVVTDEPIA